MNLQSAPILWFAQPIEQSRGDAMEDAGRDQDLIGLNLAKPEISAR